MKQSVLSTIASVLTILLLTFHLADDIVRGLEKGGPSNLVAIPIERKIRELAEVKDIRTRVSEG